MRLARFKLTLLALILHSAYCYGQQDSIVPNITEVPLKFIKQTNDKIDKYSNRITSKTEKTLNKLSKWEEKIHRLLQKADPATAEKLFGQGRVTFASMLQKIQEGKALSEQVRMKYDPYSDKLISNVKYIETQKNKLNDKYAKPLQTAKQKVKQLEEDVAETETAQALIKERKKELLTEAYKVLGKSKYLSKINKEAYYYTETLRNYKELFSDSKKAEQKAFEVLNKIPAVKDFMQKNSILASLFGGGSGGAGASIAGLQTRASVNNLIQSRIAAGGPNAAAQVSANMQAAQAELTKLKDKILKAGGGSSDGELPDFKPKEVKSKTFKQRIEIGSNFQFGRPNRFTGSQADIAMSAGYKLNDKSIVGLGFSYKMDYGSINDFYIRHGGVGLRSFVDYKFLSPRGGAGGGFFISGGYEMNYNQSFKSFRDLSSPSGGGQVGAGIGDLWQRSGLIGISKKINLKTKWVKGTKFQLLYDMLYKTHLVETQPVVFRVGYNF